MTSQATLLMAMNLLMPSDVTKLKDFLGRLNGLPSYESCAESDFARWVSLGLDIKYFEDNESVTAEYVALTRTSIETFSCAFESFQAKLWEIDHPAWRLADRPKLDSLVRSGAKHIRSSWLPDRGAKFSTLFWLMFDDPAQEGVNPWKYENGVLILQAAPPPLSGSPYSIHAARIPRNNELKQLRRLHWQVRYQKDIEDHRTF